MSTTVEASRTGATTAGAPRTRDAASDAALRARIRAEYREMPGMRLTVTQAARLFNLEAADCARVLHTLVSDGTLWTNGREYLDPNFGRRSI
jgi:hypothetical protein